MDREKLSCSICLDLLKDPVTIPCGHTYCMSCIKNFWDEKQKNSCPQCRQSFTPRPALMKNTMLAELVEELKKTGLADASPHPSDAGPADVACDFCVGRKMKAFKSCLACMASYCELHLQPHFNVAPLKKHKLVEATSKLQENICPRHDEVMKIFCRSDRQCICYLCSMDEHKGHNTVSAAAERTQRLTELGVDRKNIHQRIQDREKDVKVMQQRLEDIGVSADKAVSNSEEIFKDLISLIEKKSSEVKEKIRTQQKTDESLVKEQQKKMQQEISELRRKDAELEKLSSTEDHLHFLNSYPSVPRLTESTHFPMITLQSMQYFEEVVAAASRIRDKLQTTLSDEWTKSSQKITEVSVQEPETRALFLKHACQITLDPNTANTFLSLSNNNRKATLMPVEQSLWVHPEKFITWWQVLSCDGLTGRCYWEVKWTGSVSVAVAYRDISRTGSKTDCGFGNNEKSWALECRSASFKFKHNNVPTSISGPQSSRVGVYLDHSAGTLSFYSVTKTMNLLHRVQTRFTQPLYPGVWLLHNDGDSAELCEIK